MEDLELDEVKLAEVLYSMLAKSSELLVEDQLAEAGVQINEIEGLMEHMKQQGFHVDSLLVLMVLQNKACVAQRLEETLQCAAYLEACVFNLKIAENSQRNSGTKQRLERLRARRTATRIYLQMAVLQSKESRRQAAKEKARAARREFNRYVKDSLELCNLILRTHSKLSTAHRKQVQYEILDSPHYLAATRLVGKAKPILEYLYNRLIKNLPAEAPRLLSRSPLGVLNYKSQLFTSDTTALATVQPVHMLDFSLNLTYEKEFCAESLNETVVLGIGVHYCLATELANAAKVVPTLGEEARNIHRKILEVAESLLPEESPLLEEVKTSYHYTFGTRGRGVFSQRSSKRLINTLAKRSMSPGGAYRGTSLQSSFSSTSAKFKKKQAEVPESPMPQIRLNFTDKKRSFTERLVQDIETILTDNRLGLRSHQPEPTPSDLDEGDPQTITSDALYGLLSDDEECT